MTHFDAVDEPSSYWTDDGALHVYGASARVRFTRANTRYTLVLARHAENGRDSSVIGTPYVTADVYCKYVRREVRKLSASDKEAFLTALELVHRLGYVAIIPRNTARSRHRMRDHHAPVTVRVLTRTAQSSQTLKSLLPCTTRLHTVITAGINSSRATRLSH